MSQPALARACAEKAKDLFFAKDLYCAFLSICISDPHNQNEADDRPCALRRPRRGLSLEIRMSLDWFPYASII